MIMFERIANGKMINVLSQMQNEYIVAKLAYERNVAPGDRYFIWQYNDIRYAEHRMSNNEKKVADKIVARYRAWRAR